jgi:Niemann-Pick C1 protein
MSERSIPDELKEEITGNAFVVLISYLLMFFYISFAIGSFLVGIAGILIIIFSIVSSIGLTSMMGLSKITINNLFYRNDYD